MLKTISKFVFWAVLWTVFGGLLIFFLGNDEYLTNGGLE